jgi:hypothetical protein
LQLLLVDIGFLQSFNFKAKLLWLHIGIVLFLICDAAEEVPLPNQIEDEHDEIVGCGDNSLDVGVILTKIIGGVVTECRFDKIGREGRTVC